MGGTFKVKNSHLYLEYVALIKIKFQFPIPYNSLSVELSENPRY